MIPVIATTNQNILNIRPKHHIVLTIELNTIELNDRDKYIKQKVYAYENKVSCYGYIVKIYEITNISLGIVDPLRFDGTTQFKVDIICSIFDPKPNHILVGCKLIKTYEGGHMFKYDENVIIFTDFDKDIEKNKYYNIKCQNVIYNLNKSLFYITYFDTSTKNRIKNTIHIKSITTSYDMYKNWEKMGRKPSKQKLECVDYFNKTYVLPFDDIVTIKQKHQLFIRGELFYLYESPIRIYELGTVTDKNSYTRNQEYFNKLYTELDKSDDWTNYIQFMLNPYELLYPSRNYTTYKYLKDINPVSRAFYKAYEIVKSFNMKEGNLCISLGDAPGGWAQCFQYMFNKKVITTSYKGVDTTNNNSASIIYNKIIESNKNITIDYLKNKDGDLLNKDNIAYLIQKYGKKCDIVGSDGALAYKSGSTSKEIQHTSLMLSELTCSVYLNKKGGHAFIKIYTTDENKTHNIIDYFSQFYEHTYIYKPVSIKIFNTERMIVLYNHLGNYPKAIQVFTDDKLTTNNYEMFNMVLDTTSIFIYEYAIDIMNRIPNIISMKQTYINEQKKYINKF